MLSVISNILIALYELIKKFSFGSVGTVSNFIAKQALKKSLFLFYLSIAVVLEFSLITWFLNSFPIIPIDGIFYSLFESLDIISDNIYVGLVIILFQKLGLLYILSAIYYILMALIIVKTWQNVFNRVILNN